MERAQDTDEKIDLSSTSVQELELLRWNAFLERDSEKLSLVHDEALNRRNEYADLADGCAKDILNLRSDSEEN